MKAIVFYKNELNNLNWDYLYSHKLFEKAEFDFETKEIKDALGIRKPSKWFNFKNLNYFYKDTLLNKWYVLSKKSNFNKKVYVLKHWEGLTNSQLKKEIIDFFENKF
jgi:hypothetical protein